MLGSVALARIPAERHRSAPPWFSGPVGWTSLRWTGRPYMGWTGRPDSPEQTAPVVVPKRFGMTGPNPNT